MQGYKLTTRGKILVVLVLALFIYTIIKGNIYFAVFSFVFCALSSLIIVYEVYFNKGKEE